MTGALLMWIMLTAAAAIGYRRYERPHLRKRRRATLADAAHQRVLRRRPVQAMGGAFGGGER